MAKWAGGLLRGTRITPAGSAEDDAASGVWRLSDAAYWVKQSQWPVPMIPDSYFNTTALLLSGNGSNNANNNTFVESSTNGFTVSRSGNTRQGTISPYGDRWSNYFDGSSTLTLTKINLTGDFTIEGWIYHTTSNTSPTTLGSYTGGDNHQALRRLDTGKHHFYLNGTNVTGTIDIPVSTWNHLAVTRSGSTVRLFTNGVLDATLTKSGTFNIDCIGGIGTSTDLVTGYISDIRVIDGTALYTSSFTPTTTPLTAISGTTLLTCQSNRFLDNSTNNRSFTVNGSPKVVAFSPYAPSTSYNATNQGGSGYFDGTGDCLSWSGYTAMAFGSSAFTIEAWVYLNAMPTADDWPTTWSNHMVIATVGSPNAGDGIGFLIGSNRLDIQNNDTSYWSSNHGMTTGQWYHLAVSRSSNTLYFFVNGVAKGTAAFSSSAGTGSGTYIGCETGQGAYLNGYISGLRCINGTALYTSAFTPPTTPPTAVTNTSLLMNFANGGVVDSTRKFNFETLGNARISTSEKKYGTGSIYFDGTTDWLEDGIKADWTWLHNGVQDWTVEWWMYATSTAGQGIICTNTNSISGGVGMVMGITQIGSTGCIGGHFTRGVDGNRMDWYTAGSIFSTNTWTHVACMFNKTTKNMSVYINGTAVSTTNQNVEGNSPTGGDGSSFAYVNTAPSFNLNIGKVKGGVTDGGYFSGYLDDLRITRGLRRYTSNFTPPTLQLPTR